MPVSSFGTVLLTRFISSSLALTVSASLAPQPLCCSESLSEYLAAFTHPLLLRATLSEELHTPPLPVTHVFVGYCWSYSRFTSHAILLTWPNNDTPSLRSCLQRSVAQGLGSYIQQSALLAELKPLTRRNLTVIRSMQMRASIQVSASAYGSDSRQLHQVSLRYTGVASRCHQMGRLSPSSRCDACRT